MDGTSLYDINLINQARRGTESAFTALVNRNRSLVFGTICAVLKNADDTADAAQETFILAFRHLDQLEDSERFSSWLHSIARNVALKWLRKRTLEARGLSRVREYSQIAQTENGMPPNRTSYLKEAIRLLPQPDRTTTTLYYLVGLSQEKIASAVGIPVGTVKSRLHRSRQQLKRRLLDMERGTSDNRGNQQDYGRRVVAGMRGVIHWQKLIENHGLANWRTAQEHNEAKMDHVWTCTGEAIVGEADYMSDEGYPLIIGDSSWKDYELSLLITPISGGNAQVFFRISEDERNWYLLDFLLGWQAVAISKVAPEGLTKLSVVNYPIELGQEYDVQIAAREASLTTYIDGKLVNQLTDFSYQSGPIALNVWQCKTAFRDVRLRHLH
ncbi:MAG: sigma-70 family RNA polymerase sigma factor [Gemmatimonadetes bacterium]|nr:sigma-70 family RNA polymerase sigma factor [Gemmatimonadota bacterium]MDE3259623.1 sigma-70 family RNA polymerase sigma factor [Gemmatimonadota bacterium]